MTKLHAWLLDYILADLAHMETMGYQYHFLSFPMLVSPQVWVLQLVTQTAVYIGYW